MSNLAKKNIKKLCKNENCSPIKNDISTEKCSLCDGYFADNGINDLYFLEENNESGTCSLCPFACHTMRQGEYQMLRAALRPLKYSSTLLHPVYKRVFPCRQKKTPI